MPNLANAKKALRQSQERARRNLLRRGEIDSMRRQLRKLTDANKMDEAAALMKKLQKALDKAVQKNVYKKNTVSRILSRAAAKVNAIAKKK